MVSLSLCAISGPAAEPERAATLPPAESAYFEGRLVQLSLAAPSRIEKPLRFGPWHYGARVRSKPMDKRSNFYIVVPGDQAQSPAHPAYDHTNILSRLPHSEAPREWDVYWAIVLDPALQGGFRTESELILAAQREFVAGDLLEFNDLPAADFLRTVLKIDDMQGLSRFRRESGNLPQLAIVPAGFAVRAGVEDTAVAISQP